MIYALWKQTHKTLPRLREPFSQNFLVQQHSEGLCPLNKLPCFYLATHVYTFERHRRVWGYMGQFQLDLQTDCGSSDYHEHFTLELQNWQQLLKNSTEILRKGIISCSLKYKRAKTIPKLDNLKEERSANLAPVLSHQNYWQGAGLGVRYNITPEQCQVFKKISAQWNNEKFYLHMCYLTCFWDTKKQNIHPYHFIFYS
jgi:hypothetical protein